MSKRRKISLDHLGLSALLQLQAQGVDVSSQLAAKRALAAPAPVEAKPGYNKYHVSPKEQRTFDGIVFDSKFEMACYRFLRERRIPFELKTRYTILEPFVHNGKKIRGVEYEADFKFTVAGQELIVDTKGMKTPVFLLKQKLMLAKGHVIHCVKSIKDFTNLLNQHGLLAPLESGA